MQNRYNYKYLLIFLSLVLIIARFLTMRENMISWDVFGYYLYLPAKFIYHDLGLINQEWLNNLIDTYQPTATLYQAAKLENGNWVMQYWMGLSVLFAPFFFVAHFLASILNFPADGLSLPYVYSITIGGIIYAIIGLFYLCKILNRFFDKITVLIVMVLIFFGTNYFQLTAFDGTLLSHNFLFTFYAILTYYTIKWYDKQKIKYAVFIGVSVGLIFLMRPSEFVCAVIPLLWYNKDQNYFSGKIELFKTRYLHLLIAALSAFLVFLPQIIYWKTITGDYLFYSYTNAGEGLDLWSPHTINFLFSFRKGWLIYTPIMMFSLIGFYFLYKQKKSVYIAVIVFIILDIYIISSYTNWWYAGGSFSSRSLVPAYVILAISLGYFIEKIKELSIWSKSVFGAVLVFLVALNLFQTWQFEEGIISKLRMTKEYYFAVFGKTKVSAEDEKLLLIKRSVTDYEEFKDHSDYVGKSIYNNDFDELTDSLTSISGVFVLDENNIYSPGIDIKYKNITEKDHAWITIRARIFITEKDKDPPLLVSSFHYKGKAYKYKAKELDKAVIKYNEWIDVELDYLTPEVRTKDDNLKVYFWNRGMSRTLVDILEVMAYEKKY